MGKVLVSAPLVGGALDDLRALHEVDVGEPLEGLSRGELLARLSDVDALIPLPSNRVDEALLDRAPGLRVVANHAVGLDNVDLEACKRRGIVVTNTPDVLTDATADFAMTLMLGACRRIREADALARSGTWRGFAPTELVGVPIAGSTLGIVGLGRIGKAVARRAKGFGRRVVYAQRSRDLAAERDLGVELCTLDALIAESDVVSLHCPLTDATRGLMSRELFARMKRGAVIVNTARGACIDESALLEALDKEWLFAAALDVFADEPQISAALRAHPKLLLAPHIGSADRVSRAAMARIAVDSVIAVLGGRDPRHRVV